MTPTDYAKVHFEGVANTQSSRILATDDSEFKSGLSGSLGGLGSGLAEMATGLRATYMLLEQVNKKLDQLLLQRR